MLDGVDAMIVRTIMQVLLLALHCTLGSQMIVLPCSSHTYCNEHDVGLTDPLNLSISVSGGK